MLERHRLLAECKQEFGHIDWTESHGVVYARHKGRVVVKIEENLTHMEYDCETPATARSLKPDDVVGWLRDILPTNFGETVTRPESQPSTEQEIGSCLEEVFGDKFTIVWKSTKKTPTREVHKYKAEFDSQCFKIRVDRFFTLEGNPPLFSVWMKYERWGEIIQSEEYISSNADLRVVLNRCIRFFRKELVEYFGRLHENAADDKEYLAETAPLLVTKLVSSIKKTYVKAIDSYPLYVDVRHGLLDPKLLQFEMFPHGDGSVVVHVKYNGDMVVGEFTIPFFEDGPSAQQRANEVKQMILNARNT